MDFADALHLPAGKGCGGFLRFGRRMARAGKRLSGTGIVEP
jgi:hypothetical protein